MTYFVTAPLVVAKMNDGKQVHIYQGAPLPDGVDADQLEQLVESKMVAETVEAEEPAVEEQKPPHGNAKRDAWVEYARSQGAPDEELADEADGGLSKDDLKAKYGA